MQWPLPLTSSTAYPLSSLQSSSPFESLFRKKPDYLAFKVFGCACYPFLHPYNKLKFQFHSSKCIFLGYSPHHKGYRCLDSSGRVYISKDVTFHETKFPFQEHSKLRSPWPPITHTYPLTIFKPPTTSPCTSSPLSSQPASPFPLPSQYSTPTSANTASGPPTLHSPIPSTNPPSSASPLPSPRTPNSSPTPSPFSSSPYSSTSSYVPSPNSSPLPFSSNPTPMLTRFKLSSLNPIASPQALLTHSEPTTIFEAIASP